MDHKPLEEHKYKLKDLFLEPLEKYKKINCPSCNNSIPAANININDKIAKCNSCDVVFPFQKEIENLFDPPQVKQEVIRPEGIDIFRFRNEMDFTIQQPLVSFDFLPLLIYGYFPPLLLIPYFSGALPLHWLILAWALLVPPIVNLINRKKHKIYMTIDDQFLHIKWRPKKFVKDKKFEVDEIDQIYTKSYAGRQAVFMIVNGIDGQKHIPLLQGLTSLSKARYLEQEIERFLGIPDRRIPEESI